jgi:hypothetical protein
MLQLQCLAGNFLLLDDILLSALFLWLLNLGGNHTKEWIQKPWVWSQAVESMLGAYVHTMWHWTSLCFAYPPLASWCLLLTDMEDNEGLDRQIGWSSCYNKNKTKGFNYFSYSSKHAFQVCLHYFLPFNFSVHLYAEKDALYYCMVLALNTVYLKCHLERPPKFRISCFW